MHPLNQILKISFILPLISLLSLVSLPLTSAIANPAPIPTAAPHFKEKEAAHNAAVASILSLIRTIPEALATKAPIPPTPSPRASSTSASSTTAAVVFEQTNASEGVAVAPTNTSTVREEQDGGEEKWGNIDGLAATATASTIVTATATTEAGAEVLKGGKGKGNGGGGGGGGSVAVRVDTESVSQGVMFALGVWLMGGVLLGWALRVCAR